MGSFKRIPLVRSYMYYGSRITMMLQRFNYVPLLFLLLVKCGCSQGKIQIEILFETLCPDTLKFLRYQFFPVWPEIAPYVDVKFVPFGKSESLENGALFFCQHGPRECAGNKIISCGLRSLPNQSLQVEFVKCIMDVFNQSNDEIGVFGRLCSSQLGLDWEPLRECTATQEGTLLQLQAERDTKKYDPDFIPTIVYNGKFDQQAQDASVRNFKAIVCGHIRQTYPDAC